MRRWSLAALTVALVGAFLVPHSALGFGHHAARAAKTQHILIMSTNPADNDVPYIVARGPIHALGRDHQFAHKDVFKFPNGSITVTHKATGHQQTHDAKTCYFKDTEHGTFKVTGGTGAYAGASGSGKYHVSVNFVACKHSKPKLFQLQIRAAGPLTL
jgi:hypothetical protein